MAGCRNPTGGHIEAGRYVVDSYAEALLNPNHYWAIATCGWLVWKPACFS